MFNVLFLLRVVEIFSKGGRSVSLAQQQQIITYIYINLARLTTSSSYSLFPLSTLATIRVSPSHPLLNTPPRTPTLV